MLAGLKTAQPAELALPEHGPWDAALEQLFVYFAYRHIGGAPELDQVPERAAFAVQSYSLIRSLCALSLHKTGRFALDVLVKTARLYSSEIEYSEENMEALFAVFRKNFMRG